jgi:DNA polymerase-3 subunit gamma/tau
LRRLIVSHAFYRKWRPSTFDEVVGQEHITQTLRNAIAGSRIVHAYLFSGPRGTGKTSTARILAKAVNCLSESDTKPCNQCRMCQAIDEARAMDLIEIDAASHTGVDDIRDLRDKISFAPSEARYKFYIIDEVHMLSTSAFNALLKTLEEPPPHAMMVLATTEPHKIPATVLSRCQRFDFRPIPLSVMIERLRSIASREGLPVQDGALELIAHQSTGSMRDAESLLDQVASFGDSEITLEQVQTMLGTTSSQAVKELVDHLATRDVAAGLTKIGDAVADGADPRQLNKELLDYLRGLLIVKTTSQGPADLTADQLGQMRIQAQQFSLKDLVDTIRVFSQAVLDVKGSAQPQLPLELAFVEAILARQSDGAPNRPSDQPAPKRTRSPAKQSSPSVAKLGPVADAATPSPHSETDVEEVAREEAPAPIAGGTSDEVLGSLQDRWSDVVAEINRGNRHIAAVVRDCPPVSLEEDALILKAQSHFHKQKLESDRARALVEDAIAKMLGRRCRVGCVLASEKGSETPDDKDLQGLAEDPVIKAGLELGGEIGVVK